MSAHDRAAAMHARRFTLTVTKTDSQCVQSWDIDRLTAREVEAKKQYYRELYEYAGSPFQLWFESGVS